MMSLHNIQRSIGLWVIAIGVLTSACEKEITIDLPDAQNHPMLSRDQSPRVSHLLSF